MEPTEVIFACDESGAKGYADQDEQYPGQVGVFAGILVPETEMDRVLPAFQTLIPRYTPPSGKLHIADLAPAEMKTLRADVYAAVKACGLPCFWYAVHVAGLHAWHNVTEGHIKAARIEGASPRIKRQSPRSMPPSLHEILFTGVYSRLIAFLEERQRHDVSLVIRSDQIDPPIVKSFQKAAAELLDTQPTVKAGTGFDAVTKSVVHGQVRLAVNYPPEMAVDIRVRELVFEPTAAGDGLVLAADVLANSLYHLFRTRGSDELYGDLNSRTAVARHPLFGNLDAFDDWGSGDIVGDRLYRHPLAPPP